MPGGFPSPKNALRLGTLPNRPLANDGVQHSGICVLPAGLRGSRGSELADYVFVKALAKELKPTVPFQISGVKRHEAKRE
jgi:hypothetical protein